MGRDGPSKPKGPLAPHLLRCLRVENDFVPPIDALIEILVGFRCFAQRQFMGDDGRWLGAVVVNELHQLAVVGLHIALPGADLLSFEPEVAEVEGYFALLRKLIRTAWILRDEHAHYADIARELDRVHQGVHYEIGDLLSFRRVTLITDAFATAVRALAIGSLEYLLDLPALILNDGSGAELFCQGEAVGVVIHNEDSAGALDPRGESSHQAHRARAVDNDRVSRGQIRETSAMPAGREDIRKHDIVAFFLFGVFRQDEAVVIAIGNPEELGLAAAIGSHIGEAVGSTGHIRYLAAIGCCKAEGGEPTLTISAKAAPDVKGKDDAITDLNPINGLADFDNLAQIFMPKNAVPRHVCAALVHVKIGSADVGSGDTDQHISRLFDSCILDIFDRDFAGAVIHKRFHSYGPLCSHPARMQAVVDGKIGRDEQLARAKSPKDV